jgi:3-isopropylmalate/(R)-2-methylmalate dehydratase large subunit
VASAAGRVLEPGRRGPLTLLDKVWADHEIVRLHGRSLLYVDRYVLEDASAVLSCAQLDRLGLPVKRPAQAFAVADHFVPSVASPAGFAHPRFERMVDTLAGFTRRWGIRYFGPGDPGQGIAHVVGPEQGLSLPGMTIVCGDSHTATHGALGCLAYGIGSTELTHVLATQTNWQRPPKRMRVSVDGPLGFGMSAKDVILHLIQRLGTGGGVGYAIEYSGSTVRALSIEQRMTVCNMSIEAGAKFGMVAPDDATFSYLSGRPHAPAGAAWDRAVAYWRTLPSDAEAQFDREVAIDAHAIEPTVTWGTSLDDTLPISACVPDPAGEPDPQRRAHLTRALQYMGLTPGTPLTAIPVDHVFIGTCTNARLEDLRAAAAVVRGRRARVPAIVVPGSSAVKRAAEAEGLHHVLIDAGFEWRSPGCSMCCCDNGDRIPPGERCASTQNRNYVGRQGPGARTHLMSPAMAAAAALTGRLTDVREVGPA